MKNMYYHPKTNQWFVMIDNYDDSRFLVKKKNTKNDLCCHAIPKEELLNLLEYTIQYIKGDIFTSIDRDILKLIDGLDNPQKHTLAELSQTLQIDFKYFKNRIDSLEKRGYLIMDNGYDLSEKGKEIFQKSKKRATLFKKFFTFLVLFLLMASPKLAHNHHNSNSIEIETITFKNMVDKRMNYIENQDFNFDLFIEYLELNNVPNKVVVISQAILETNTFKSEVFNENNNLFGMKQAMVRPTKATGTNRGHATYDHWTCSVKDYKLWYDYFTTTTSYNDYLGFLAQLGYAEDPYYLPKLREISGNLNFN